MITQPLHTQQCNHTGAPGEKSPDRLDAAVYGITRVAVGEKPRFTFG